MRKNYLGIFLRCLFWLAGICGWSWAFSGDGHAAGLGTHFAKYGFLEGVKNQSRSPPPAPAFVPCQYSAPVACVVRIAGILITQLQPSARILGDPGKHTLLQGHGQVTESRLPKPREEVFLLLPLLSLPAPNPGLILELLNNNRASSSVRQDHFKAAFFLFGNYLISERDSQICKIHVCGNKPLLLKDD